MNNLELIGIPILQRREKVKIKYPLVDTPEWAKQYFKNNPNVSGMAIGGGMNGITGDRQVILNPYTDYNKDSVLKNERLRHYFDESNFKLPNITKEQMNKYKGTPYEGDSLNIGRTEASRYLSGDKHLLTKDQIEYIKGIDIPYFKKGSGIHIKKKNRGKFTDYCDGKVTQKCIDKAKQSEDKKLVKRATFAENAKAWKHQQGGELVPSRNWDNTLTGKLINYSENPDSIGWDAKNRRWYAPPANKGYDTNQFGMGVDRNQTPGFKDKVKKDKQGREYLTEEDERYLRFLAIDRANKSANDRYAYAQKATGTKGSVSPKHDAITVSAIYNLGSGRIARTLFENIGTMKALFDRNSDAYQKAVHKLYKAKDRNERVDRELEFFKKRNMR